MTHKAFKMKKLVTGVQFSMQSHAQGIGKKANSRILRKNILHQRLNWHRYHTRTGTHTVPKRYPRKQEMTAEERGCSRKGGDTTRLLSKRREKKERERKKERKRTTVKRQSKKAKHQVQ